MNAGILLLVSIVVLIMVIITAIKNADNMAQAKNAAPVKATVISIMPGEQGQSRVVFEMENGERANVIVPRSEVLAVGDVGMLKHHGWTFNSFSRISK